MCSISALGHSKAVMPPQQPREDASREYDQEGASLLLWTAHRSPCAMYSCPAKSARQCYISYHIGKACYYVMHQAHSAFSGGMKSPETQTKGSPGFALRFSRSSASDSRDVSLCLT